MSEEFSNYCEDDKNVSSNVRSDKFCYQPGEIKIGKSQCDFCKYNDLEDSSKCTKYPDGKPKEIVDTLKMCEYLSEDKPNIDDILGNLKEEYKEKKDASESKEEIKQIKQDYKEMKHDIKQVDKLIKKDDLLQSSEDFWSNIYISGLEDNK